MTVFYDRQGRELRSKTLSESFQYDDLNRLTQSQVSGQTARTVTYNNIGNILTKDGVSYTYSATKPHAVSRAGTIDYAYDANGNVTQGGDNSVLWTPFNQPFSLFTGDNAYTFFYDNDHGRVLESIFEGGAKKIKIFAGGLYEEVIEEGSRPAATSSPPPRGRPGSTVPRTPPQSASTCTAITSVQAAW